MSNTFEEHFTVNGETNESGIKLDSNKAQIKLDSEGIKNASPSSDLEKLRDSLNKQAEKDVDPKYENKLNDHDVAKDESSEQARRILDAMAAKKELDNLKNTDYVTRTSIEVATDGGVGLIVRPRASYVTAFKKGVAKTARATLDMSRVVYEAKECLDGYQFNEFCTEIGFKDYSSTIRKFVAIGKVYHRFIEYADQLPASWTNIYLITQIPADFFEECIQKGVPLSEITGKQLTDLVKSTRPISNISHALTWDKYCSGVVFGKVIFTRYPDDIDWRAMEKAFAEMSARLPIKFVVNKEAADIVERRRDQRYDLSKKYYNNIELRPELWDMGTEANAVVKNAERAYVDKTVDVEKS